MTAPHCGFNIPKVQFAAGGIVWRTINGVEKLAVIHRPKYDDWTLPKGKPEPGEALAETARREVWEEIGFEVEIGEFAGVVHYPFGPNTTKVVLFWHMTTASGAFRPNNEVDELVWLGRPEAMAKLSHDVEQELLRGER